MDATTRERERALSGGDPAAVGRLFSAYVRSGQVGRALALVAGRALVRLPPRARPVGWFASGRGLLVSVFDAGASHLEAGGEPTT